MTATADERLLDPDGHYPYKAGEVTALLEENGPMGHAGPDDDSKVVADYISQDIINATDAYIAAQADFVQDQTAGNKAIYDQAKYNLQQARAEHRSNRGESYSAVGFRSPLQ